MNHLEKLLEESEDFKTFSKKYFSYLHELLGQLDTAALNAFVKELEDAREEGRTIFIAGNGGSAATASHMGNDMGLAFLKRGNRSRPFRVFALTDNVPLMTAIGNDEGYENIFLHQLMIHHNPGDRFVVISASGNSTNLVKAAEWVRANGGRVLGLLGFDGGKLKSLCDVSVIAETPKGEYGPVEDVHMILDHLITTWFYHLLQTEKAV